MGGNNYSGRCKREAVIKAQPADTQLGAEIERVFIDSHCTCQ